MSRLEELNNLAKKANLFKVIRMAKGHYYVCDTQQDYLNVNSSSSHYSDHETLSYEGCYDHLNDIISDNQKH